MISLIIGAGQLGSRHLQGLLKFDNCKNTIYVLDPSEASLKVAYERSLEVKHIHKVLYVKEWTSLPRKFDFVIVATNSHVREKVVINLLENYEVKDLILEKVLFDNLDSYSKVGSILSTLNTNCYVNHSRRMYESYQNLKLAVGLDFIGNFQIVGGNWGLACNGLHFLDLFEYFGDSKIRSIDADWVSDEIVESSRVGFVEFNGTIKGTLENGSIFNITSTPIENSYVTISIFNSNMRYVIQEFGSPSVYSFNKIDNYKLNSIPFIQEFQSDLTTKILLDIYLTSKCDLTKFTQARHTHEMFIKSLLAKYNNIKGINSNTLPIT